MSATRLAITLDREPAALRSTRNRPRTAVRRGASWTAASHQQLTVAAVARPVRSSVVPSESLLPSSPGLLLAQTAAARRSVRPTSSGRGSSPRSTVPGRQRWRRSPVGVQHRVSTHPGRPGSGGPAVRCPARPLSGHLGWSSGCPAVRSSAVQPSGVRPSGVHPSSVQLAGVRPIGPDTSVSSHSGRWRWPGSVRRAPVTTGTGRVPVGGRVVERFGRLPSRPGRGRCCRARALVSGMSVADPAGLGAGGGGRRCRCAAR
jgi:hypothetical protein